MNTYYFIKKKHEDALDAYEKHYIDPNLSEYQARSWFDRSRGRRTYNTYFNQLNANDTPEQKKKIALLGFMSYQVPRRTNELAQLKMTHINPENKPKNSNYFFREDNTSKIYLNVLKGTKGRKLVEPQIISLSNTLQHIMHQLI